MATDVGIC